MTHIAELLEYCYTYCMHTLLTMTNRGVVTLPAKMRQAIGLRPDEPLIAELTADGILLRPAVTMPLELYTPERVREFDAGEAELAAVLPKRAPARRKR